MVTTIVIGALVLVGLIVLVRASGQAQREQALARERATPRRATVLSWSMATKPSAGAWTRGKDKREVHLRVHVPDGEDYTATSVWCVAPGKGDLLVEGGTIAVRVHARRAGVVFPDEPWLVYALDDYLMKR